MAAQAMTESEVDGESAENMRFEYQMAQEMLCHYDNLNWHIGSILIAGVLALSGLYINKDLFDLMVANPWAGGFAGFAVPSLSLFVLVLWWFWFD